MPFPILQGESIEVTLQFALLLRDGFANSDQLVGDVTVMSGTTEGQRKDSSGTFLFYGLRPGPNLNLLVGTAAGLAGGTALTNANTLILTSGATTVTFTVNTAAGPIKTVTDLMTAINADATVGARASLDAIGHLNIQDPALRGNLAATGSLALIGADLGAFGPVGGPNPNLLVGTTAGLAGGTALTDAGTLILTSGAATVTFTVNTAAGPIKTVADLVTAINADATVGARASLDAIGHLNIQDPALRGNLAATGSLALIGADLGAFGPAGGPNPNLLVGTTAGLAGGTALTDAGTLILTSGAATVTFTVNTAAGPIKTVADLVTAINADATVGARASLDAIGHLNIQDPALRGNLVATGSLAVAGADLGAFAPAPGPQPLLVSSGQESPYYLPMNIAVTLPAPSVVWPAFPDVTLADPTLPLGDPGQTPGYKAQRQAATLLPTTAYPFLSGTTLIRGTVMHGSQPLADATVQQTGGTNPAYITGADGQFVLFLSSPPGLPQQVTVNAKHAGLADANANVTVLRGLTVSVTINM